MVHFPPPALQFGGDPRASVIRELQGDLLDIVAEIHIVFRRFGLRWRWVLLARAS
jgi:hypothetical protein